MKVKGVKQICSDSKRLVNGGPSWLEVFYDAHEKKAWSVFHCGLNAEWTEYKNSSIIRCGNIYGPITQQEVEEFILERTARRYALA